MLALLTYKMTYPFIVAIAECTKTLSRFKWACPVLAYNVKVMSRIRLLTLFFSCSLVLLCASISRIRWLNFRPQVGTWRKLSNYSILGMREVEVMEWLRLPSLRKLIRFPGELERGL